MLNKDLIDITHIMGDGEAEIIPLLTEEDTKDLTVTDIAIERQCVLSGSCSADNRRQREVCAIDKNSIQKQGYNRSGGTMCCRYRRP